MPVILRSASDGRLDRELAGVSFRQALAIRLRIVAVRVPGLSAHRVVSI